MSRYVTRYVTRYLTSACMYTVTHSNVTHQYTMSNVTHTYSSYVMSNVTPTNVARHTCDSNLRNTVAYEPAGPRRNTVHGNFDGWLVNQICASAEKSTDVKGIRKKEQYALYILNSI